MANDCSYVMKVMGTKENVKTFIDRMTYKEDDQSKCFKRIFECYVDNEGYADEKNLDSYFAELSGVCAWSLESCCRERGYAGVDLFAINTKELNLKLEAWSDEDGFEFQEHYIYDNGDCILEDCVETLGCIYWDKEETPDFEDFIADCCLEDKELLEEDFDEDGNFIGDKGGFSDDWGSWSF